MKLTDKRFWRWEITTTLLLSAIPCFFYGECVGVIILIVLSYAIASAVGLMLSSRIGTGFTWLLIFGTSLTAYFIDLILIDTFRLIRMESYPLIIGQIYLLPIFILCIVFICVAGGAIMRKANKIPKGNKR